MEIEKLKEEEESEKKKLEKLANEKNQVVAEFESTRSRLNGINDKLKEINDKEQVTLKEQEDAYKKIEKEVLGEKKEMKDDDIQKKISAIDEIMKDKIVKYKKEKLELEEEIKKILIESKALEEKVEEIDKGKEASKLKLVEMQKEIEGKSNIIIIPSSLSFFDVSVIDVKAPMTDEEYAKQIETNLNRLSSFKEKVDAAYNSFLKTINIGEDDMKDYIKELERVKDIEIKYYRIINLYEKYTKSAEKIATYKDSTENNKKIDYMGLNATIKDNILNIEKEYDELINDIDVFKSSFFYDFSELFEKDLPLTEMPKIATASSEDKAGSKLDELDLAFKQLAGIKKKHKDKIKLNFLSDREKHYFTCLVAYFCAEDDTRLGFSGVYKERYDCVKAALKNRSVSEEIKAKQDVNHIVNGDYVDKDYKKNFEKNRVYYTDCLVGGAGIIIIGNNNSYNDESFFSLFGLEMESISYKDDSPNMFYKSGAVSSVMTPDKEVILLYKGIYKNLYMYARKKEGNDSFKALVDAQNNNTLQNPFAVQVMINRLFFAK